MPPVSATMPPTVANRGVHGGIVISQTMMSPGLSFDASLRLRTTLATPCTVPGEAAVPLIMLGSVLGSGRYMTPSILLTRASSNGSSSSSDAGGGGGKPSVGAGTILAHSRISLRRWSTVDCQERGEKRH